MELHQIKVSRTAHYATLGTLGPETRYLVIACHGYGQLARHFIRKFDVLADQGAFIVAPEGLSSFYWQGFGGDVGASWMTRENRLDEIADYVNYLTTLYQIYRNQMPSGHRVILVGFSQGCATQVRWLTHMHPDFDVLMLWAGSIPEDIDYTPHHAYLADKDIHTMYGTADPFLNPERLEAQRALLQEKKLMVTEHTFAGEHVVDRPALLNWFNSIR